MIRRNYLRDLVEGAAQRLSSKQKLQHLFRPVPQDAAEEEDVPGRLYITVPDVVLDWKATPPPPPETMYGAIRMWRIWRLTKSNQLQAITRSHVWEPGENVCDERPEMPKVPEEYWVQWFNIGQSGFYGFMNFSEFEDQAPSSLASAMQGTSWCEAVSHCNGVTETWDYDDFSSTSRSLVVPCSARNYQYVIGSTLNYGRVVTATKGARAEKAVPEYLVLSPENEDFNYRLLQVADRYEMKLVTLDEAKNMPTGLMPYDKLKKKEG